MDRKCVVMIFDVIILIIMQYWGVIEVEVPEL
jgi:hypothetical protein